MFEMKRGAVLLLVLFAVGGLTVGAAGGAASTQSGDIVVDDGGTCPGATETSIQDAVDNAPTGGTIRVCSGVYQESVTVHKQVEIVAANDSDGSGRPVLAGGYTEGTAIDVQADGVTIDGLSITEYGDATTAGVGLRVGNQQDVTINGTAVNDTTDVGVAVVGGASNVEITYSAFSNVSVGAQVTDASGVTIETVGINETNRGIVIAPGTQGSSAEDISVHNVAVNDSDSIGIDITAGTGGEVHDVSVRNVSVNHSGVDGIQLQSSLDDGVMTNVTVENAVLAHNPVDIRADINSTTATPFDDVDIRRVYFDVSNGGTAVHVDHDTTSDYDLSIREAVVEGDSSSPNGAALLLTSSTNASALDYRLNIMRDVAVGVDNLNDSSVLNARQNYWGADNGPGGGAVDPVTGVTADGDGATITTPHQNVIFDPWLGKPTCQGADGQLVDAAGQLFDFPTVDGVETDQVLSVCAWNRAAFPLRTDDATARTTIPLPSTQITADDVDNFVSFNKRSIPIYQVGEDVTVTFSDSQGANTTHFADADGQVIVLRSNDQTSLSSSGISAATFDDETLTAEIEPDGFTVEEVRDVSLNESGDVEFTHRPSDSSQYAYVLVRTKFGDGVAQANGNVTVNGGIDVVGIEGALIQETDATATPQESNITAGENLTVDVSSNLGSGGTTNHTVMLYNETTVKEQQIDLIFTKAADEILSAAESDFVVDTTIDQIAGVFVLDDGVTVAGITFESGTTSGAVDFADVVDTDATVNTISPATTLHASMTVVPDGGTSRSIDVGTFENFTAGEYEFVYVAESEGSIATKEGTVTIEAPSEGGTPGGGTPGGGTPGGGTPGGGIPGGGTPGGGGEPVQPPTDVVEVNVTTVGRVTYVNVTNATAGQAIEINTSDAAEFDRLGFDLERVAFTPTVDDEIRLRIQRQRTPSSVAPPLGDVRTDIGYVIVSHPNPDADFSDVRLTFSVNQQTLAQEGIKPDSVSVFRYRNGQYDELTTAQRPGTTRAYRYRAESPGLSVFALGGAAADISIPSASLSRSQITTGESVDVTAQLRNDGGTDGTKTVELRVAGEVVDTREVTIPAGETREVTFTRTFEIPGTYDVAVNDASAGRLTVQVETTESPTESQVASPSPQESPTGTGIPQPGGVDLQLIGIVVVFLIVLATAAILAYERYDLEQ